MSGHPVLGGGDVPSIAWPALFSDRIAPLAAQVHQFEASQWLPREAIEAGQRAQLSTLSAWLAEHVPAFRARLAGHGLSAAELAAPDGLAALPPLTRRDLIANYEARPAHALPAGHGTPGSVRTSGSTGEPVTVWKSAVNNIDWLALTLRLYRWTEPDFTARLASVRAFTLRTGEFPDWGTPVSHFHRTGPLLSLPLTTDIEEQLSRLAEWGPNSLLLHPSTLSGLLIAAERRGVRIPGLKRVRTMGETLSADLRARAANQWSVSIHDCYSSEEAGYLALQCPAGGGLYHCMDETVIVEVIDDAGRPCAPGETGRVVVTDLRNHATPLIRYAIGDYAVRGGQCLCGRGHSTLERIMGRERNLIRNPDGTSHWPVFGTTAYRDIAPVLQAQLVQHSLDELELRLVCERPLTGEEQEALRRFVVEEKLKQPFRLAIRQYEGALPMGENGKFEEVVRSGPGLADANP